jgi:hypothetical protein
MTPQELRKRTKQFAIDVVRFCVALPRRDVERVIGHQLLRAGTSVGANYRGVCRALSDRELIARLASPSRSRMKLVLVRNPRRGGPGATAGDGEAATGGRRAHQDLRGLERNRPPPSREAATIKPRPSIYETGSHQSPITNHQSPTTNRKSQIANGRVLSSRVPGHKGGAK